MSSRANGLQQDLLATTERDGRDASGKNRQYPVPALLPVAEWRSALSDRCDSGPAADHHACFRTALPAPQRDRLAGNCPATRRSTHADMSLRRDGEAIRIRSF